jgi:hypothetical protein
LSIILYAIKQIHYYSAEKKLLWHELSELKEFTGELILSCLRNSLDTVVSEGAYTIEFINIAYLEKNIPTPDELLDYDGGNLKIKDLPKDRGHDNDLQWNHVSSDYIRMMAGIAEEAIKNSKPSIASSYSRGLISLSDKVFEMSHLSDGMKKRIVGLAYYHAYDITEKLLKFNVWHFDKLPFPFSEFSIDRALELKAEYSKDLLLRYSEAFILLTNHQAIDRHYLNDLGTLGRSLTRKLSEDKHYRQSFKVILKTFSAIRKVIKTQQPRLGNENLYTELYDQLLSLKSWLLGQKGSKIHLKCLRWVETELNKFDKHLIKKSSRRKYSSDWPESIR